MFLHELAENLVVALEFGLEQFNRFVLGLFDGFGLAAIKEQPRPDFCCILLSEFRK